MATETMKIVHKGCGVCFEVKRIDEETLKGKKIKCPKCGRIEPFSEYYIYKNEEPQNHKKEEQKPRPEPNPRKDKRTETYINRDTFGRLKFNPPTLQEITLKEGRYVIGRKCEGSNANIQIPINNDSKRTSREHIVIEVKKISTGIIHCVSLNKERVNTTYINKNQLKYGDKIILRNGDVITLPDVAITFTLPDNGQTQYDEKYKTQYEQSDDTDGTEYRY